MLPNEYFLYAGHWYATVGGLIALNDGSERMLTPLPVFHMNAMAYSAMAMVTTGGCLIVLDRFHPKSWWASVRDSRATIVHYLGVMPPMLMGAPESADDKRHGVRFGFGAGVDKALHDPFEARFGFPLVEAWAMTETGAGAVVVASQEPRHTGTSCFGRLGSELEARIVVDGGADAGVDEPGELLVRHAGAAPRYGFFREYLKDAEATAEAWDGGWFHTGDVVRRGAGWRVSFRRPQEERDPPLRRKHLGGRGRERADAAPGREAGGGGACPGPGAGRRGLRLRGQRGRSARRRIAQQDRGRSRRMEPEPPRLLQGARLCRVRVGAAADLDAEDPARRAQGAGRCDDRFRACASIPVR